MADEVKRIGVMVGREWSWPPAFIEEVNRRKAGVVGRVLEIGGTRMNEANPYAVIIDRISHEIPYYRTYLKNAVLQGHDRRQQSLLVERGRQILWRVPAGQTGHQARQNHRAAVAFLHRRRGDRVAAQSDVSYSVG